ncbi:MAG: aminotransferase class I/II-fold pyridoxal phosphate-dependent enzyme [Ignavibacteriae bacterium]|nr:aminotransferase class I/II-fold pyridoxal phosphate-dependent enzyme [Ignavibacteriota bacterium]
MNNLDEFKKYAYEFIDWIVDYYKNIESYPVKSQVKPKEIFNKLPDSPPENSESIETIFKDFQDIILPGITHWQSPNFYAYFPANSSYPSLLAEMLMSALGVQGMKWETSPAATELEEKVMNWLKVMIEIPERFSGVIQDTASTATLVAIISAREKFSDYKINKDGFKDFKNLRVYCSTETHSSIEKAVKIAGIGKSNLVKVKVDEEFRMNTDELEIEIKKDIEKGYKPLCVIAALGTTGSTAVDPLEKISVICKKYNLWLHVDAAYAGSALILPEYRWMLKGIQQADSFIFNPHKWLFTNFDCSAYFVKENEFLIRTFEILPEYLKTQSDSKVNNYCDWGIPLGRRFRALKLWFVIRSFGVKGLQGKLRYQISIAKNLETEIRNDSEFEILAPVTFNLICFRYKPKDINSEDELNKINEKLLHKINDTGKIYISHTKLNGKYTLRMVIGQTNVNENHVNQAWELIKETSKGIK